MDAILRSYAIKDGEALAYHVQQLLSQPSRPLNYSSDDPFLSSLLSIPSSPDSSSLHQSTLQTLSALIPVFSPEAIYLIPTLRLLSTFLLSISPLSSLSSVSQIFSKLFNLLLTDRNPLPSRKLAILFISVQTLRIYFALDSFRLCQTLVENIEREEIPLDAFPLADQIGLRYYRGRLLLTEMRVREAEEDFMFCLDKVPVEMVKTRRIVLFYLLVVRLLLGKWPSLYMWRVLQWNELERMVYELKKGNLKEWLACMEILTPVFRKRKVNVILKQWLYLVCYRNLVRRVFLVREKRSPPLLLFKDVEVALRWMGEDVDENDAEDLVISLISQGYIKGYVHGGKKLAVLSVKDPFPAVYGIRFLKDEV